MTELPFETYRKLFESWLAAQQDVFRKITAQWPASDAAAGATGASAPSTDVQKQTLELAVEVLSRHRESLDASYRSFIQSVEQIARVSDAKSPEQVRNLMEEIWRRWLETLKTQTESQLRDARAWADKSLNIARGLHA